MGKLDILWATGRDFAIDWEYSWIMELLSNTEISIRNVVTFADICSDAIVVVNHNIPYVQYLHQYQAAGIPFGLIHLSDEYINDDITPYYWSMCKFVLRTCYRPLPDILNTKVTQFALGYKYGFWNNVDAQSKHTKSHVSVSDRQYVWSFAGGVRENRVSSLHIMESIRPHKIVVESGNSFNDVKTGLSTDDYRDLMCNSIFVLCPVGNVSVDCFRVYEALECGAIPIVIRKNSFQDTGVNSYWETLLEYEPAFIMADTMEENVETIVKLLALDDMAVLAQMQARCIMSWQEYKQRLRSKIQQSIIATRTPPSR